MSFKKISSLVEYATWILKKYNGIKKTQEGNIYRLVEIKKCPRGKYKITIQVIGKSSVIDCSPEEIIGVDQLLEGFSKKDIRTITYLASNQVTKPKYKIIMQSFCEHVNKIIFKLKETTTNLLITKTANQIMIDKNIINNLSNEDLNSISYTAGYESSQNDSRFLEKNITNNKPVN